MIEHLAKRHFNLIDGVCVIMAWTCLIAGMFLEAAAVVFVGGLVSVLIERRPAKNDR